MPIQLMYITNRPEIARIADCNGVDIVIVDLETKGKELRQKHLNTVKSNHSINDIPIIKKCLETAKLLVRINPPNKDTADEVDAVIAGGADIVMLPYFCTAEEASEFIDFVAGRAQTCLLVETPAAVDNIDKILEINGIDRIHIGLNDLHLGYGMKFMFQLLVDGTVEQLCNKFHEKNLIYGFGGIARMGQGKLPAEYVIAEHVRLGSRVAILSRSFCNTDTVTDIATIDRIFRDGIREIREFENSLKSWDKIDFIKNCETIKRYVEHCIS